MKPPINAAALALLAWLATGCLIVPVREAGYKVTASFRQQAKALPTGASREDVIRQLGQPSLDFPDLATLGYRWTGNEYGYYWAYCVAGGYSAAADAGYSAVPTSRVLWFSFDEQGGLAHRKLTTWPVFRTRTPWEVARKWRESVKPPLNAPAPKRFNAAPPPPGQALLHIFWDDGTASPGVQTVWLNGQRTADLRHGAFTSLQIEPGHHELWILSGEVLGVDAAPDQVCYVRFGPDAKSVAAQRTLTRCPEPESLKRLKSLTYCK